MYIENEDNIQEEQDKEKIKEKSNKDINNANSINIKIKKRIENNLNQLDNLFKTNTMKETDEKIKKLKGEADAYHNKIMNTKFKVRTETYTKVKRSYSFLGVVFGVLGGVIGGVIGGVTGGVGGALCGIAIGGLAGYSLGSFIESLI